MDKNVIVISKGLTFMVNTIFDKLRDSGYEPIDARPEVEDLKGKLDGADLIVVYLGDFIEDSAEAFIYLRDVCIESEKYLYMIGSKEELKDVKQMLAADVVTCEFERPINVKDLINTIGETRDESLRKKSILVVDDDGMFLRSVHDWLSDKYRVTMVNSGMNAITYLAKHTPDLILLDYEMPIASGPQVLEMIRSETSTSDTPVMFLTGKGDKESVMKVLALKPNGYLLKTMKPMEIHQAVDDFFRSNKYKKIE